MRSELQLTDSPADDNGPLGPVAFIDEPADAGAEALSKALTDVPLWEKRVLELSLAGWGPLDPDQTWAAERLRVFLLTWDPFEWRPDRAPAFATSTRRSDGFGLVLYLPYWQALWLADGDTTALPAVFGQVATSVLAVAGESRLALTDGSYAEAVQAGRLPALLARIPDSPVGNPPVVTMVGPGWEPIQFDVLEDLAQELFGPADLDRGPVRFKTTGEGRPGCPGCDGEIVEFPDGLKDTQDVICAPHRAEALQITTARLEAAKSSNPAGWEALLEAGQRLSEPHLPHGLGPRMVAAALVDSPSVADLRGQVELIVGAAGIMAGLPDPETALGTRLAPVRTWLEGLPATLAAHGLTDVVPEASHAADELLANPSADQLAAVATAAAEEAQAKPKPFVREVRVGRNASCPCGSGKKYKFCHGAAL